MSRIRTVQAIGGTEAFSSFAWDADEAARYNLIYGWNASGKTTLGRALRLLEVDAEIPEGLEGLTCRVKTTAGVVTQADGNSATIAVRVFNEEFLRDNLSFGESQARPIIILGKVNVELQKELDALEERITKNQTALDDLKKRLAKAPDLQAVLTDCGREVPNQFADTSLAAIEYNPRSYTRANVQRLLKNDTIDETSCAALVIADEVALKTLKQKVQARQTQVTIVAPDLSGAPRAIATANTLLQRSVHVTTIARLEDDAKLAGWTREGYDLHTERSLGTCEFCGGVLPEGLLKQYGSYFTDEVADTERGITAALDQLAGLKSDLMVALPDSTAFFQDLGNRYAKLRPILEAQLESIRTACEEAITRLKRRSGRVHAPGSEEALVLVPEEAAAEAQAAFDDIHSLCDDQETRLSADRDSLLGDARELELHTIAKILVEKDYFSKEEEQQEFRENESKLKDALLADRAIAAEKRAELRNTGIALIEINELIAGFLGPNQIVLEERLDGDNSGYRLLSRGRPNRFPSEGEKSIVGLAYFITKLREEGCAPENTIVVLDDPVDSQDSNFLFRTASLLRRRLKLCSQVFILTHNFDFFNLVRDWINDDREEAEGGLFWIEIEGSATERTARLRALPSLLRDYKSEYQYLASRLIEYARNTDTIDAPVVPNIARKVLEYFGSFKWSCRSSDRLSNMVYQRFVENGDPQQKELGGAVLKFLNEYSHGRDFGRPITAAALEGPDIARSVMAFIKMADKEHYEALAKRIRQAPIA